MTQIQKEGGGLGCISYFKSTSNGRDFIVAELGWHVKDVVLVLRLVREDVGSERDAGAGSGLELCDMTARILRQIWPWSAPKKITMKQRKQRRRIPQT